MPSWSTFLWYNYFMRHIFQRSQFLFKQSNIHDVCCLHKVHSYERKLVWWLTAWDLGEQSWRWEMSCWAFDIIFSGSFSIFATFHLTFSVIKWSLMPVSVLSWNAVGTVGWQALARDPAQRQHQVQPQTNKILVSLPGTCWDSATRKGSSRTHWWPEAALILLHILNWQVPTYHCMHTPGGPLKYSLEGHQFAIFAMKLSSDNRYIISCSNKFITFDVVTSDLARQVNRPRRTLDDLLCRFTQRWKAWWLGLSWALTISLLRPTPTTTRPSSSTLSSASSPLSKTSWATHKQSRWNWFFSLIQIHVALNSGNVSFGYKRCHLRATYLGSVWHQGQAGGAETVRGRGGDSQVNLVKIKLLEWKMQWLSSMKTLDTLDSYSLVTWSGSQEDPSMVRKRNLGHKNVRFLTGLVHCERWRTGSNVEGSQCGDDKREADSGLPLWHRRKLHRCNVQVETDLELLEELLI